MEKKYFFQLLKEIPIITSVQNYLRRLNKLKNVEI